MLPLYDSYGPHSLEARRKGGNKQEHLEKQLQPKQTKQQPEPSTAQPKTYSDTSSKVKSPTPPEFVNGVIVHFSNTDGCSSRTKIRVSAFTAHAVCSYFSFRFIALCFVCAFPFFIDHHLRFFFCLSFLFLVVFFFFFCGGREGIFVHFLVYLQFITIELRLSYMTFLAAFF